MSSKDKLKSIEEMLDNVKATKGEQFAIALQIHLNVFNMVKLTASFTPPEYAEDVKGACNRLAVAIVSAAAMMGDLSADEVKELTRLATIIDNKSFDAAVEHMKESGMRPDEPTQGGA